jgi:hypothetical protein
MPMLRNSLSAAAVAATMAMAGSASAAVIPYPTPGTKITSTFTYTVPESTQVTVYFVGASAAYTELAGVLVNGSELGAEGLNNHTSAYGDKISLGTVAAGDIVSFYDHVLTTGAYWYSGVLASDGADHAYVTPVTSADYSFVPGGAVAAYYVGFEDLKGGDYDYNDVQFVITFTAVPELSTWGMMIAGFAGLGFVAFRARKTAPSAFAA